jgi:hypothetical protein
MKKFTLLFSFLLLFASASQARVLIDLTLQPKGKEQFIKLRQLHTYGYYRNTPAITSTSDLQASGAEILSTQVDLTSSLLLPEGSGRSRVTSNKHKLAGGIVMTAIGGSLCVLSIPLAIGAIVFISNYSGYGYYGNSLTLVGGVFLGILSLACAGAGVPLLIVGISKINKARKAKRSSSLEPYAMPTFGYSSASIGFTSGVKLKF